MTLAPASFGTTLHTHSSTLRVGLYALFVLSGFAALIYQSIWTQYLGLLLGHAAYAQTLVLMMFMGGMAGGAWLVSRYTLNLRRLIGSYALVEAAVGVLGLAFHPVFVGYSAFTQETVLPTLQGSHWAVAWQWSGAALLIAPQTLLLGATFPLIASGLLRVQSDRDAETLGTLYFTNGLGAAIGVLVATFILLPQVGLPGAMLVAASMNLLLAAATAWISHASGEAERPARSESAAQANAPQLSGETSRSPSEVRRLGWLLITATFLSSAASFGYEIGWVRLLNQALGTTLHGFELMLAAFIAGMALGGLWVRRHSGGLRAVVQYAGWVQVAMGVCALLSIPLLGRSFEWVGWTMRALAPSGEGYLLYSVATALIAMLIMMPAAFFAGMTLPLFTTALLRAGAGEPAVGRIYAANTLGAILGVATVVHVLIPSLGVSLSLLAAAALDVLIGLVLLRRGVQGSAGWRWTAAAIGSAGLLALVMQFGMPSPLQQAAGSFRYGRGTQSFQERLLFFKDGATATVSVKKQDDSFLIATNGKPDASLRALDKPPTEDEITMLMLGALPLAAHPDPKRIAVIGWGSGLSTHTVLGSALPERVDTIEIEPAMREGATLFMDRNHRAYLDSRSEVHYEDARLFFSSQARRYDVLISEPSNPWVSGVANLFTQEFYALARRHLSQEGMFVQWLNLYEMTDSLVAEMVAALLKEFPNSEAYLTNRADLLILARTGAAKPLTDAPWQSEPLRSELARVGLRSAADLKIRRIGGPDLLSAWVAQHNVKPHSDFYPTVSLKAPAARFERRSAWQLSELATSGLPVLSVLACQAPPEPGAQIAGEPFSPLVGGYTSALGATKLVLEGLTSAGFFAANPDLMDAAQGLRSARELGRVSDRVQFQNHATRLANATLGWLDPQLLQRLWDLKAWERDLTDLSEIDRLQLKLYDGSARRDWHTVRQLAQTMLKDKRALLPAHLAEQVLVLGMLADAALGERNAASNWQKAYGEGIPPRRWASVRSFIPEWLARRPACAAGTKQ